MKNRSSARYCKPRQRKAILLPLFPSGNGKALFRDQPGNLPFHTDNIISPGPGNLIIKTILMDNLFLSACCGTRNLFLLHFDSCIAKAMSGLCLLSVLFSFINIMPVKAQEGNFIESDFFKTISTNDKPAILMVSFGTTHDDTRAVTIDAVNALVRKTFPSVDVFQAFTSRIVIRRLKERGIEKLTPKEMLLQLHAKGYTHILVQSTNVIDGVEMESLRDDIETSRSLFKEIRLGTPLLYHPSDFDQCIDALTKHLPKSTDAVIFVGHGTYTPATASYTMIDYMLRAKGLNNYFIGTIEGYPSFDDMLKLLRKSSARSVLLVPFMLVAGEHADNDIAKGWNEKLTTAGYTVKLYGKGMGENPDIQQLFIDHLKYIATHKEVSIMQKKQDYANGKEKE